MELIRFGFDCDGVDYLGYYRLVDGPGVEVRVADEKRVALMHPSSSIRWLIHQLGRAIIRERRLAVLQERAELDDDASADVE